MVGVRQQLQHRAQGGTVGGLGSSVQVGQQRGQTCGEGAVFGRVVVIPISVSRRAGIASWAALACGATGAKG
ncbi:hypothetical protein [Streptomyces sp. NPDC005784]|uniref:hypothetical protein n=1 Tax=Streptomyces sp. NPDC005784 TaxID=3364731 RepID=UPI0036C4409F